MSGPWNGINTCPEYDEHGLTVVPADDTGILGVLDRIIDITGIQENDQHG